ncbi:MAG: hypothetical protein BWZ01_03009 [Deltaproteobacteria bacterium ADurb.BinA179]|nr:MAG: hypothetical protein BWZ01_03009 [Deltaproteobacteria bacterium ADurb.BinA179]
MPAILDRILEVPARDSGDRELVEEVSPEIQVAIQVKRRRDPYGGAFSPAVLPRKCMSRGDLPLLQQVESGVVRCHVPFRLVVPPAQKTVCVAPAPDVRNSELAVVRAQGAYLGAHRDRFLVQAEPPEAGLFHAGLRKHERNAHSAGEMAEPGYRYRFAQAVLECSHESLILGRCALEQHHVPDHALDRHLGEIVFTYRMQRGRQNLF